MNPFTHRELERIAQGDLEVFKKLFDALYVPMVQRGAFYVNDIAIAEDMVQEIFTRIWGGRRNIVKIANIEAYMMRMVKNSSLNHIKHKVIADKYLSKYMIGEVSMQDADPEPYVVAIANLLEKLPEKRKQVLEMSIFDSKSYPEIALELGISVNTVKDHMKKAYVFLRQQSEYIPYP